MGKFKRIKRTRKSRRKYETVDWDDMPSPNPRYKGMTVLDVARALLKPREGVI